MNLEQIKASIENYNNLLDFVKSKIKVLEKNDIEYSTYRGIQEISFEVDDVYVTCDDSWPGTIEYAYFNFPIQWLSYSDEELAIIVTTIKEKRLEEKRRIEEERAKIQQELAEKSELEQFEKLKAKYENIKYAVYEKEPAHQGDKNGIILAPFNSKEEAEAVGNLCGYHGENYYVDILK